MSNTVSDGRETGRNPGGIPSLAVVVVSFNRARYLSELIQSLVHQEDAPPFEFVLLDNGSSTPLEREVGGLLEKLPGKVTVIREDRNAWTPARLEKAVAATTADVILVPGDDDVALPNYLRDLGGLAARGPDVTLVSGGMQVIDSLGQVQPGISPPSELRSQPEALGYLMQATIYSMPATGFRRDAVDLHQAPRTRIGIDWWLWIQCWLAGRAETTARPVVQYRVHAGQEKAFYGQQSFRLDAGRMLASVVSSERFERVVMGWTDAEVDVFARVVMNGPGPGAGDSRWGPLIQLMLVDRLLDRLDPEVAAAMHAQAAAQSGSIASIGQLRNLLVDRAPEILPPAAWSRVPITAQWETTCPLSLRWREFLQIPEDGAKEISIRFRCSCEDRGSGGHRLTAVGRRRSGDGWFRHACADEPDEAGASMLLDDIGQLTGRKHGFEPRDGWEGQALALMNRLRRGALGRRLMPMVQRARSRSASVRVT